MKHTNCDECGAATILVGGCQVEVDNLEVEHECDPQYAGGRGLRDLDQPAKRAWNEARAR